LVAVVCGSDRVVRLVREDPGHRHVRRRRQAGSFDHPTVQRLVEALHLLDPLPAWSPSRSRIVELGESPKHHLVDPALAASLLGVGVGALLDGDMGSNRHPRDGMFLGALFESLVILGLRVFAQSAHATVGHFRTHRDHARSMRTSSATTVE